MASITGFMYSAQTTANVEGGNIVRSINMPMPSIPILTKPTEKSFSVSFCMADLDVRSNHELQIVFKHGENTIIDFGRITMEHGKMESELFLNIDIRNIILQEEGQYETVVFLDGNEAGRFPIKVRLAEQKPNGGQ